MLTDNNFVVTRFKVRVKGRHVFDYNIPYVIMENLSLEISKLIDATRKDCDIEILIRRNKRVKDIITYLYDKNIFRRRLFYTSITKDLTHDDLYNSWMNHRGGR